jgi:hypothetical protein
VNSRGGARFARKPEVKRLNGKTAISFAAAGRTDVAVSVLGAGGRVVRHLAAGLLGGEKAPPPPLQRGLAQKLTWDGKDDYGKPATGGPFKVRVALGLKPEFSGFINWHPDALPRVHRVAVGPGGRIYYFYPDPAANGNMGGWKVRVRTREGKHARTLVPFPAAIRPGEVKAFGTFTGEDGHVVPRIHNWESMTMRPTAVSGKRKRDLACDTPVVDSKGRLYWIVQGEHLVCVDAQGHCPYPTYLSQPLFPGATYSPWSGSSQRHLALSSDEKSMYVSAVTGLFGHKKMQTRHCVYRVDLATRAPGKPFAGDPGKSGGGKALLSSPRGVAAAKGLLYVADAGNDRIAAFKESDGSYAGEVEVQKPQQVTVDAGSGALYVLSDPRGKSPKLLKFAGLGAKQPSARMDLPKDRGPGMYVMALDTLVKPVRIYFPQRYYVRGMKANLNCFEESGGGFKAVKVPSPKGRYTLAQKDLWVDQGRGELYIKSGATWSRFDVDTGEFKSAVSLARTGGPQGGQVVADSRGRLVSYCWVHRARGPALKLWTREGKPIPAKGKGWSGMMNFQQNYMDIFRDELYVIPNPRDYMRKKTKGPHCLTVFGMDLKPKRTVIWQCSQGAIPKLDNKGNIYLAENVRPLDRVWPEFFDGKLPKVQSKLGAGGTRWYSYMYGSVVKFSPKGGAVWFGNKKRSVGDAAVGKPGKDVLSMPERPFRYCGRFNTDSKGTLQGAEWVRFGFSPYSNISVGGGGTNNCMCEGAGFDVDAFGRVFYPNLGRFRVEVIDNNNNTVCHFGKYGNADSQLVPTGSKDGKPLLASPAIPLCWPTYVAAGDNFAYVADLVSMRTVKVRLNYRAEETCPLP